MDIRLHRSWMYNRLNRGRKGFTDEFLNGLNEFVSFALQQECIVNNNIRCPCSNCKNVPLKHVEDVKLHLLQAGFKPNYWYWTCHGESNPELVAEINKKKSAQEGHNSHQGRFLNMVYDAVGPQHQMECEEEMEESPNINDQKFYDLLHASEKQLWPGCNDHTELSTAVRLLTIKSEGNISQRSFNQILALLKETHPPKNLVPVDYYRTRKIVSKLGLTAEKIDCCVNGCMLFYTDECKQLKECKLKRLYTSMSSAPHMRWHYENKREPGVMCHPSDGEAWKHFDQIYPDFAAEEGNVRLGLCTDGFSPFNHTSSPYSCWPVIVTPYNLPPELCMTTPYMFLTLIIPGPHNPKSKIDVYLQPLIDELKLLWNEGVLTYDISRKKNFIMKAALMWTINDFPAYGMLSGWSTAGKLACPYCMDQSKAFFLKHGGKCSWFDSHRKFLPMDHAFRRNKNAFYKDRIEESRPPKRLTGDDVWEKVSDFPKITEVDPCICDGFVMDIKDKTKDNAKARMDIKKYCRRKELELQTQSNGKVLKPKAKYVLSSDQQKVVYKWVSELKMPDGHASNLHRCVNKGEGKLIGMKSHDFHVFMERLLPIAFSALPHQVWSPIAELSKFFKDLCSTILRVDDLLLMEQNIVTTTCKLEKIFPPGFFNSMEHVPIHLPYEARVGGPVQYRWMYPFERYLNRLKQMVKNRSHVEGSICEAYLCQETSHFCSYYFESHVQSLRNRVGRNDDGGRDDVVQHTLSIFNHPGRFAGTRKSRYLDGRELAAAHLHILLNCEEVQPFIELFVQYLKESHPNICQTVVDGRIASEFPRWFRAYVHDKNNMVQNLYLHQLAHGPKKKVHTWPIYFVNGFKFHTEGWSDGKKTINCGVCVKGDDEGVEENYYYGNIKEIMLVEYLGEPTKQLVLFNCEWFDVVANRGMKVQHQYGIVEVNHRRRYSNYDPFIFATNAIQVYYVPYPGKLKEKIDWWVAIKTKPRGRVDDRYTLEVAYQDSTTTTTSVDSVANEELHGHLIDEGEYEEIEMSIEELEIEHDENDEENEDEFDFENSEYHDDDSSSDTDDDDNDGNSD
ncbi:hypothetical protein QL285_082226 [Trifolium repens]|nr:hypothetical protein QL285_082226 [Trifolium repens]